MATETAAGTSPETTATQDSWVEIAAAIRAQVRKGAELIPAMTPAELKDFIEAAQYARKLELDAESYDKDLELLLARVSYYG